MDLLIRKLVGFIYEKAIADHGFINLFTCGVCSGTKTAVCHRFPLLSQRVQVRSVGSIKRTGSFFSFAKNSRTEAERFNAFIWSVKSMPILTLFLLVLAYLLQFLSRCFYNA
jgi:hypothetical protein